MHEAWSSPGASEADSAAALADRADTSRVRSNFLDRIARERGRVVRRRGVGVRVKIGEEGKG